MIVADERAFHVQRVGDGRHVHAPALISGRVVADRAAAQDCVVGGDVHSAAAVVGRVPLDGAALHEESPLVEAVPGVQVEDGDLLVQADAVDVPIRDEDATALVGDVVDDLNGRSFGEGDVDIPRC